MTREQTQRGVLLAVASLMEGLARDWLAGEAPSSVSRADADLMAEEVRLLAREMWDRALRSPVVLPIVKRLAEESDNG